MENLVKGIPDWHNTVNKNFEEINSSLSDLTNGATTNPIVTYGMNNVIKNTSKSSTTPKFIIKGKTIINLLGKDGNCEEVGKWNYSQTAGSLDTSNKMFGNNGFKITLTNTNGSAYHSFNSLLDTAKYYAISAYVKNGNATKAYIGHGKDGNIMNYSQEVTDATKFTRVWSKLQPSNYGTNTNTIALIVEGSSGQYAYFDGVMVEEITQKQYNDLNFRPSLYVDSYTCLQNPYIEVRHNNLVRNGNGEEGIAWWVLDTYGGSSLSCNGNKIVITKTDTNSHWCTQKVKVKPNTDYYVMANLSDANNLMINITDSNNTISISTSVGTFNTGQYSEIGINLQTKPNSPIGSYSFDSIMLIEGTTAPTEYKSCKIERCVVEGKFADGDMLTYENGEVTGLINWKHKTLFGKDYDWQFDNYWTGDKSIKIVNFDLRGVTFKEIVAKYDGKILTHRDGFGGTIRGDASSLVSNIMFIDINNSDSGWADTINPNSDEVKCFMNGWRAARSDGTSRYVSWISVIDGSLATINNVFANGINEVGQNKLNVSDVSKFAVGTVFGVIDDAKSLCYYQVTAISGSQLTLNFNLQGAISSNNPLSLVDDSSRALLNYCKNNIAQGYEGYQLHYKLSTPEPITDYNCHVEGDIPLIELGDNYLVIDSGVVLDEIIIPTIIQDAYHLNDIRGNIFRNKTEDILAIYKNQLYDTQWIKDNYVASYGNTRAWVKTVNFVGADASFTVDYKILATQAPQIGNIECSYSQDIISTINKLNEEINTRQTKDSILDEIVDKSMYEVIKEVRHCKGWVTNNGAAMCIDFFVQMLPKKVFPKVTIGNVIFAYTDGTCTYGNVNIPSIVPVIIYKVSDSVILIRYTSTDPKIINAFKTYGFEGILWNVILDCRDKI